MVKVEIRPGIFIRLTEEDARKRGISVDAQPPKGDKASAPTSTKAKKSASLKPAPKVEEAPAEEPQSEPEDEASE